MPLPEKFQNLSFKIPESTAQQITATAPKGQARVEWDRESARTHEQDWRKYAIGAAICAMEIVPMFTGNAGHLAPAAVETVAVAEALVGVPAGATLLAEAGDHHDQDDPHPVTPSDIPHMPHQPGERITHLIDMKRDDEEAEFLVPAPSRV